MLWGSKNFIFEYERIISPNRSFNVSLGYRTFPKFSSIGKSDSALIVRNFKSLGGLGATLDYRFYLQKENKYNAPRGIYIGPYAHYLSNNFDNTLSTFYSDLGTATLTTRLKVLSLGFQLGYQFIFYDRFSLDICLVGPSASWYHVNFQLDGSLNIENDEVYDKVVEIIQDKFPVIERLFDESGISNSGKASTIGYGYRYYFKIGYLF